MGRLDGKVAIVTGAAHGQGEAEARLFVAEGDKVVLGDVLDDLGKVVADDLGSSATYVHFEACPRRRIGAKPRRRRQLRTTQRFGRQRRRRPPCGHRRHHPGRLMSVISVNQVGCSWVSAGPWSR